jgi:hypothetical protein
MLHSKTLASVDLRLTRPPPQMRPPNENERPTTGDNKKHSEDGTKKKRREKKNKSPTKEPAKDAALFEDLSPEAQRRLNAMLRNFCTEDDGAMRNSISLQQYAIDSGEMITNATVQELCVVQPSIDFLNLTGCGLITDVALWTIARHCPGIKHLILSGCDKITNVGLRSLSIRCSELETLDFTNCRLLDDIGLSTIACGCWKLEKLLLVNCSGITDTGVGKVVKSCSRLQTLDLHGCTRVGEFGDHALKEIGAFCSQLVYLDLTGCRHVHNDGLTALARGCQLVETVHLSGCDGVTGTGISQLCKHMTRLKTLSMTGCKELTDRDVSAFRHSLFKDTLKTLNLSGCSNLTNQGVGAVCDIFGEVLFDLDISGCGINDRMMDIICETCPKLRSLDISRCRKLTDYTVHKLTSGVTSLTTLKLDGNDRIETKTVAMIGAKGLEFAQLANEWLGFRPKNNAAGLIIAKEKWRWETSNALKIQSAMRRKMAWAVYREKRRIWIVARAIPKYQALYRGYKVKLEFLKFKEFKYRNVMARRIQTKFRKFYQAMELYRRQRSLRIEKKKLHSALQIQRVYWGMVGRHRAIDRRNELANTRLEEAQHQAERESMAIVIQCAFQIMKARMRITQVKEMHRLRLLRAAQEDRAARLIQRVDRGRVGRKRAAYVRWLKAHNAWLWACAREVQRVYRGHVKRLLVNKLRAERDHRIRMAAATVLQCFWRCCRAKMIVAILRALDVMRKKQNFNALEIQRCWRGKVARVKIAAMLDEMRAHLHLLRSVQLIQKLFRGHKGREIAEVERALKKMEGQTKPLLALLRDLEEEGIQHTKKAHMLEGKMEMSEQEIYEIKRELEYATRTTAKFTDSSRVNGIPQRFLTKYLIVRLEDHQKNEEQNIKRLHQELVDSKGLLRNTDRRIRAAQRELVPLTTGLIDKTKKARYARLRAQVRLIRASAIKIQSLIRGAQMRMIFKHYARDYWIECFDLDQGPDPYYYNTYTLETSWRVPSAWKFFVGRYNAIKEHEAARAAEWVEVEDDGRKMWFNTRTKEFKAKEEDED